jgi:hypothetical protein
VHKESNPISEFFFLRFQHQNLIDKHIDSFSMCLSKTLIHGSFTSHRCTRVNASNWTPCKHWRTVLGTIPGSGPVFPRQNQCIGPLNFMIYVQI